MARIVPLVLAFLLMPAAAAVADPGGIAQLPGASGCLATSPIDDCGAARGLDGAAGLALSPDGRHLYAASRQGVTVFTRDAATGSLSQLAGDAGCLSSSGAGGCGEARGIPDGSAIAVSPDGAFVYVASYQGPSPDYASGFAVFSRDGGSGALTQLPGTAGCLGDEAGCSNTLGGVLVTDVAVSPDSKDVYVAMLQQVRGFRRGSDGALTPLAAPGGCLVRADLAGGAGSCQGPRAFSQPRDLEFSPDGQLLVAGGQNTVDDANAVTSFDRDASTGFLSQPAGEVGCLVWDVDSQLGPGCATGVFLHNPTALAIAPDGAGVHVAYGSGKFDALGSEGYGVMSASRDVSSGLLTERKPGSGFGAAPYDQTPSLAVSPDGRNLYGARSQFAGDGNGITAWARSGGLYEVQGLTGCVSDTGTGGACADGRGLAQARELAVSPDGRFLYAAAAEPGAVTVLAREAPGPFNDVDRDGVADAGDACPEQFGTAAGCPDSDGDGIPDADDDCPGCGTSGGDAAPTGELSVRKRWPLRKILRKGRLRARVTCDEPAELTASLRLPRKQASKLRVARAIARKTSARCTPGSRASLILRLKPKAIKRLARARRLTPALSVVLTDAAGGATRLTTRLTWRR